MLWFVFAHEPPWFLSSYLPFETYACSALQKASIVSSKPSSAGAVPENQGGRLTLPRGPGTPSNQLFQQCLPALVSAKNTLASCV